MDQVREVGIKANTYRESRNFSGLPVRGYRFKKVMDLYKVPAYLYFRITGKTHPRWLNLFWRPFSKKPRIYHFFNAINCGNQPWVVTMESYMPRGVHPFGVFPSEKKHTLFAIERMLHPSCKKLIAISEWAREMQWQFMKPFDDKKEALMSKVVVWHPPQKLLIQHVSEKPENEKPIFVMVGADFFRKGGMEVLTAFDRLFEEGRELELIIVSSLNFGDYASRTTTADLERAKQLISKHPQIRHHISLPNQQVLELYKRADVGLLPSYEETYGYSVLEAQAAGCPVISTNGAALSEINDNDCGWIIGVPLDHEKRSIPRGQQKLETFRELVTQELYRIVSSILDDKNGVKKKGECCIERIRTNHCPDKSAARLQDLYSTMFMG